ncbi:MAG: hypothetical protein V4555_18440 [Acidobacteriota bacterium]
MPAPVSILLIGRDERLLETRCLVLEASGYKTTAVRELSELEEHFSRQAFDVLILCHSLRASDVQQAVATAATQPRPPKCLLLVTADIPADLALPVARVSSREGPARLLQAVASLLKPPTNRR